MTGIIAIVKPASAKCHCFVYCPKKKNIRSGRWVEAPVEVSSLSLDNNKVTEFYLHLRRLIWFLFSLTINTDEKSCLTISIPATVSSVSSTLPPIKDGRTHLDKNLHSQVKYFDIRDSFSANQGSFLKEYRLYSEKNERWVAEKLALDKSAVL